MQALSQLSYTPTTERRIISVGANLVKQSDTELSASFSHLGDHRASWKSPEVFSQPTYDMALPGQREHV